MSARTHFRKLALCDVTEKHYNYFQVRGNVSQVLFFNHLLLHLALLCCTDPDIEQLAPSSGQKKAQSIFIF